MSGTTPRRSGPGGRALKNSIGSKSAPHFNIGPYGRGFELSRRRKKRAIGTCPYSPVSEWSPPAGRPRGEAFTIKSAFYCEGPTPGPTRKWAPLTHSTIRASPNCPFLSPP